MNDNSKTPASSGRLIPMLVLIVCFSLAETALYILAIIQFIWAAIDGKPNHQLTSFGASLSEWLGQTGRYLSYASEDRPFPWAKWPEPLKTVHFHGPSGQKSTKSTPKMPSRSKTRVSSPYLPHKSQQ